MTNGVVSPYAGPGTLNMFSNLQNMWPFPVAEPDWVDLAIGYSYSFWIMNTTAADITAGTITLWGADADPTNWCAPGPFNPLEPVAGCTAIVSGIAETGPVSVTLSDDMPIRAGGICGFAAPCPRQFLQIRGLPAGTHAIAVVGNLRRTNFDHYDHWGYIPQPMAVGIESMQAQLPRAGQQPQLPQTSFVRRGRAPQPQPAPGQPQ